VSSAAIAADGSWLATDDDKTARIWDAATGDPRATLTGHTGWVQAVAIAADGSWLATGSADKTARIWDPATRRRRTTRRPRDGCHLAVEGWGRLIFSDSSPAAGRDFTDGGMVHETRGLKGRARQARTRKAVRNVPIPPELVALLREHLERFGTGPDGRLFRSENGNPIQPSTYWRVWQRVRVLALRPEQLATPLLQRPYDLRHSGVTWRLNSGVPATEVAAWAGHSVEVLMRVYAKCVVGLEDVWVSRMDAALRLRNGQ
jgi:WD40 repeat protein